jgi:hypothetical protein
VVSALACGIGSACRLIGLLRLRGPARLIVFILISRFVPLGKKERKKEEKRERRLLFFFLASLSNYSLLPLAKNSKVLDKKYICLRRWFSYAAHLVLSSSS